MYVAEGCARNESCVLGVYQVPSCSYPSASEENLENEQIFQNIGRSNGESWKLVERSELVTIMPQRVGTNQGVTT